MVERAFLVCAKKTNQLGVNTGLVVGTVFGDVADPSQVISTTPGLPAVTQGITPNVLLPVPLSTRTGLNQVAPWSVELIRKT